MKPRSSEAADENPKGSAASAARETKPKRGFLTVLVVRHRRPRLKQLRLSYVFALVGGLCVVAIVAAGLLAPPLWLVTREQSLRLSRLEAENEALRTDRSRFEGSLAEIAEQLNSVEQRAGRLARELGIDEALTAEAGAGGGVEPAVTPEMPWYDGELQGLRSRSEALDRDFGRVEEAFADRMRLLAATPNRMPVEGWFSHGFGWRKDPFTGDRDFHHGIDIVAPAGTEIQAPAAGVVAKVGRYGDYGKSIDIAHGFGYVTRYAHMSKILVKAGDRVRRGDVIGRVGTTGRSTGPHLHYEVFRDGRRVNPWKYLGQSR